MTLFNRSIQVSLRALVALSLGTTVAPVASAQSPANTGTHRFERQEPLIPASWSGQTAPQLGPTEAAVPQGTCDFSDVPGAVWWGTQRRMPLEQIARYLAPVYWFSPDEPLLHGAEGEDIRLPEVFPFETAPDRPVVYYLFDDMVTVKEGVAGFAEDEVPTLVRDSTNPGNALVDLERTVGFRMHFYAYFSSEEGIGAHIHDVEGTEFRAVLRRSDRSPVLREQSAAQCDERKGARHRVVLEHVRYRCGLQVPHDPPGRGGQARHRHRQERRRVLHPRLRREPARQRCLGHPRQHAYRHPGHRRVSGLDDQGAPAAAPHPPTAT
jgi:hypothetical protein